MYSVMENVLFAAMYYRGTRSLVSLPKCFSQVSYLKFLELLYRIQQKGFYTFVLVVIFFQMLLAFLYDPILFISPYVFRVPVG